MSLLYPPFKMDSDGYEKNSKYTENLKDLYSEHLHSNHRFYYHYIAWCFVLSCLFILFFDAFQNKLEISIYFTPKWLAWI